MNVAGTLGAALTKRMYAIEEGIEYVWSTHTVTTPLPTKTVTSAYCTKFWPSVEATWRR